MGIEVGKRNEWYDKFQGGVISKEREQLVLLGGLKREIERKRKKKQAEEGEEEEEEESKEEKKEECSVKRGEGLTQVVMRCHS